jgi:hypothetical protein
MWTRLLTYSSLLFSGMPKRTFRNMREKKNLKGLLDIHHIIPREFKKHPTIVFSKYDIENGYNLMFLPTHKGSNNLNIHSDRPIHSNGHIEYNMYVKKLLNEMFNNNLISEKDICELNLHLRQNMRHLDCPWY